ncbi:MAG: sulfite exporter TauE/SafE family protein [Leptospirales bacterium]
MEDWNLFSTALLFFAGLTAGIINTMAGGGSSVTIPALILLGIPGAEANATNRLSVFFQSVSGVAVYAKKKIIDRKSFLRTFWPTLVGGAVGALAASFISNEIFEPLIFVVMIVFAFYLVAKKKPKKGNFFLEENSGTENSVTVSRYVESALLFSAGFYGGFLQTGVGIYLLFVLHGAMKLDLNKANALKMALVIPFTVVALAIFIYLDLIWWTPGLIVAFGSALGARFTAKHTEYFSKVVIKWVTFGIVVSMSVVYIARNFL